MSGFVGEGLGHVGVSVAAAVIGRRRSGFAKVAESAHVPGVHVFYARWLLPDAIVTVDGCQTKSPLYGHSAHNRNLK